MMVITVIVDMRHLVNILIIVALMDSSDSQYPNCVSCSDGEYIILCSAKLWQYQTLAN